MKAMKLTKKRKIIGGIALCLILLLTIAGSQIMKNPRVRLLLSVVHFTESTLKDSGYLLKDIDIMELFHNYANADTSITAHASLSHMEKLDSSVYMDINANRSFFQKRLGSHATLKLLWLEVGDIDFYAENDTVYFVVPLLGDFGYAFPTGIDLFMKMPDLTSDIDQKWFHDNAGNIVTLMQEIGIEETGHIIVDEDGTSSEEFVITIPEGSGAFIWELLGMDKPDYDVIVSMYLTSQNHMRQMSIDLSDVLEGASLVVDGQSVGSMLFSYELPEKEKIELTMVRNPNFQHRIDTTMTYYTNISEVYRMSSYLTWAEEDKGFSFQLKDLRISRDETMLASGYLKGSIVPLTEACDVFEGKDSYLYSLESLDWREVRNDTEGFINEIINKMDF